MGLEITEARRDRILEAYAILIRPEQIAAAAAVRAELAARKLVSRKLPRLPSLPPSCTWANPLLIASSDAKFAEARRAFELRRSLNLEPPPDAEPVTLPFRHESAVPREATSMHPPQPRSSASRCHLHCFVFRWERGDGVSCSSVGGWQREIRIQPHTSRGPLPDSVTS